MVEGRGVPPCSLLVLGSLPCGARSGFVTSRWQRTAVQGRLCRAPHPASLSWLDLELAPGGDYVRVHLPEHGCMATSCVLVLLGLV